MLERIFPKALDNQFPGHKIALYVFYALTALTLWRSQHHLFAPDASDTDIIVEDTKGIQQLYKLRQSSRKKTFTPFDGLTTSGSISRGVTIGNNQNSVLNSELDLQISGKLSDKVLRH